MKIGIFTGGTSVRSKNIFTDISRYPTGKHEINFDLSPKKTNILYLRINMAEVMLRTALNTS